MKLWYLTVLAALGRACPCVLSWTQGHGVMGLTPICCVPSNEARASKNSHVCITLCDVSAPGRTDLGCSCCLARPVAESCLMVQAGPDRGCPRVLSCLQACSQLFRPLQCAPIVTLWQGCMCLVSEAAAWHLLRLQDMGLYHAAFLCCDVSVGAGCSMQDVGDSGCSYVCGGLFISARFSTT